MSIETSHILCVSHSSCITQTNRQTLAVYVTMYTCGVCVCGTVSKHQAYFCCQSETKSKVIFCSQSIDIDATFSSGEIYLATLLNENFVEYLKNATKHFQQA